MNSKLELGQMMTFVRYCRLVQNGGNESIEQYDLVEKVKGKYKVSLCSDKPNAIGIALNDDLVDPGNYFWIQLLDSEISYDEAKKVRTKI